MYLFSVYLSPVLEGENGNDIMIWRLDPQSLGPRSWKGQEYIQGQQCRQEIRGKKAVFSVVHLN